MTLAASAAPNKMIHSLLFFLLLISAHSTVTAAEREFGSFDEFIATLPNGKLLQAHASGQLNDASATYHVRLVQLGGHRTQQIFVFRGDAGGKYTLIDQSREMDAMGGSGNWAMKKVEFRDRSLYITFGYFWRGCSGQSENQFQFVNGRLAMIGNESEEENTAKEMTIASSTNLLTGKGFWIEERNGLKKKHIDNSLKEVTPFSAYDGAGWISPYNTRSRLC
jgi:hypothetical protein